MIHSRKIFRILLSHLITEGNHVYLPVEFKNYNDYKIFICQAIINCLTNNDIIDLYNDGILYHRYKIDKSLVNGVDNIILYITQTDDKTFGTDAINISVPNSTVIDSININYRYEVYGKQQNGEFNCSIIIITSDDILQHSTQTIQDLFQTISHEIVHIMQSVNVLNIPLIPHNKSNKHIKVNKKERNPKYDYHHLINTCGNAYRRCCEVLSYYDEIHKTIPNFNFFKSMLNYYDPDYEGYYECDIVFLSSIYYLDGAEFGAFIDTFNNVDINNIENGIKDIMENEIYVMFYVIHKTLISNIEYFYKFNIDYNIPTDDVFYTFKEYLKETYPKKSVRDLVNFWVKRSKAACVKCEKIHEKNLGTYTIK